MPPDLPTTVDDVVAQLTTAWLAGAKVMLPDDAYYENGQVMGIRGED